MPDRVVHSGRDEVIEVKKWQLKLLLAVALLWTASAIVSTAQGVGHVDIVQAKGPVTPAMLIYVERGIAAAEEDGAVCLILQLDTPGGSVSLAKNIVQRIAEARVPVVVYVAPRGAWAASAGTLITLAGHVAAMAPETSIGAASPVGMQGEDLPETAQKKEKEILMASARSLAERRGEKAVAWVESAIEEAKAATAQEALDVGVIDFIAGDVGELLAQLDGFTVQVHGQETILHTAGVNVHPIAMNPLERLLHAITDPTIAFILMTLGINAIIFELSSPGGYAAGIIGIICLGLGLYALGVLSVDYTGLLFIVLAFVLFIIDIKAPTHGVLTAGGIIAFIFGAVLIFQSTSGHIPWYLILSITGCTGGFFAFVVAKAVRAQTWPVTTGAEALIGATAEARTALNPDGVVFLMGERWNATAEDGPIAAGERVKVVGREGFRLRVRKAQ
ncbi:MAG TPA: nodulation protein NfeD [Anaerolineae bacterium]|nr:nodulation protein NfeD [Anaerolineae bacterium]